MEKNQILAALKDIRENSKKRKFTQRVDLIINLMGIDVKKDTDKINAYTTLPYPLGKQVRLTGLVGPALSSKAKDVCKNIILVDDFKSIDPKKVKKIASETDYFIAQADVMPKVAGAFGKVLGPKGLMPSPKAGCVVPPTGELKPVLERLNKTVHLQTKTDPTLKVPVGMEDMKDDELVENILAIYNAVLHELPQEKNNIKSVIVKLTMGIPRVIGEASSKKAVSAAAPKAKKKGKAPKPKKKGKAPTKKVKKKKKK